MNLGSLMVHVMCKLVSKELTPIYVLSSNMITCIFPKNRQYIYI